MPPRCRHDPPQCQIGKPYQRGRDCRLCFLFYHDARYRRKWGGEGQPVPVLDGPSLADLLRPTDQSRWPLRMCSIARLRQPEDRGPGDTLARVTEKRGGALFKRVFKAVTGKDCGCTDRQARMNRDYPYRVEIGTLFNGGFGDWCHFAHICHLYTKRGVRVRAAGAYYEPLMRATGMALVPDDAPGLAGCHFDYQSDFNQPRNDPPWSGSHIVRQLNRAPFPFLGPVPEVWAELAALDLSGTVTDLLTADHRAAAREFLQGMPRPVVLFHPLGLTSQHLKNFPVQTAHDVLTVLPERFPGTLVIIDPDRRVLRTPHPRVRHLGLDWGGINLYCLAALYDEAALLVGIDSGPFHFARFTRTPALGVFHGHHPSCVTLPPRSCDTNLCRRHPVNAARREAWNLVEYAGDMPTGEEVISAILRRLSGESMS